ncbi:MAG: hypothetical protein ACTSRZ_15545 [Promethearchaeota archaeon]
MSDYNLGIFFAILSGFANYLGSVFQKMAVNRIPKEYRNKNFQKQLLRSKIWLIGIFIAMGLGTICFLIAQLLLGLKLGPTLIPGLMSLGMIVLVFASVKLNKESLRKWEIIGIILMMCGIFFLGLSGAGSTPESFEFEHDIIIRITILTIILFSIHVITYLLGKYRTSYNGIFFAISSGVCFALSNFWVAPLLNTIGILTGNSKSIIEIIFFIISCIILIYVNISGIALIQDGFKYGQASNLIPIQQIPVQITPITVYFGVFLLATEIMNTIYILIGVLLVIISGFLVGRRIAEFEGD